jgi:hypothetical protein
VAQSLSLTPDQLIECALLVGNDYTDPILTRLGAHSELGIDACSPEGVAAWLLTSAPGPSGVQANADFARLWESSRELQEAWAYGAAQYRLEEEPCRPSSLATDGASALLAAAVEREEAPSGLLALCLDREWSSALALEVIWLMEGRPAVAALLRPLRLPVYALLGLDSVTERVRRGVEHQDEVVAGGSLAADLQGMLPLEVVLQRGGEEDRFSRFTAFLVGGMRLMVDNDPLLDLLGARRDLLLPMLAVRAVAATSAAIADVQDRISLEEALALIGES